MSPGIGRATFLPVLLVQPGWGGFKEELQCELNYKAYHDGWHLCPGDTHSHCHILDIVLFHFSKINEDLLLIWVVLKLTKQTFWCCWDQQKQNSLNAFSMLHPRERCELGSDPLWLSWHLPDTVVSAGFTEPVVMMLGPDSLTGKERCF